MWNSTLTRKVGLKASKGFRPRKTKLRLSSDSPAKQTKERIQALLRQIVMIRDGGCIISGKRHLNKLFDIPECNGYRKDGELILQADHLITRGNAATYADSRLVVCVCQGHHGWKSVGSNLRKQQYDQIVRSLLSPERVELWDKCEKDSWRPKRMDAHDWLLEEIALKAELATCTKTSN